MSTRSKARATKPEPVRCVVRCEFHTTNSLPSRESAERRLAEIEQLGACMGDHEVIAISDLHPKNCAVCGEPEGSPYAKHCCTDDNMIEA